MFFRKTGHFAIGVQIRMLRRKIRLFYVTGLYFAIIMTYITQRGLRPAPMSGKDGN